MDLVENVHPLWKHEPAPGNNLLVLAKSYIEIDSNFTVM